MIVVGLGAGIVGVVMMADGRAPEWAWGFTWIMAANVLAILRKLRD